MEFERVLDPMPFSDFCSDFYGRKPRHFSRGDGRFQALLSWDVVNELIERNRLLAPRLRLVSDGTPVPQTQFIETYKDRRGGSAQRLRVDGLHGAVKAGAMLVVDAINEFVPSVDRLACEIERALSEPVQANAYLGWMRSRGFHTHWDDHDVFVTQVDGEKHWRIFAPTRISPLMRDVRHESVPPATPPVLDVVLRAGDSLYIPRGWWHDATPTGAPSLHITFAVTRRTGIDYLEYLLLKLHEDELPRSDVPRFEDEAAVKGFQTALLTRLNAKAAEYPISTFLAHNDSQAPLKPRPSLPWAAGLPETAEPSALFVSLQSQRKLELEIAGEDLTIKAGGKAYVLDRRAKPFIEKISASSEVSLQTLLMDASATGTEESELRGLIDILLSHGLVAIRATPSRA